MGGPEREGDVAPGFGHAEEGWSLQSGKQRSMADLIILVKAVPATVPGHGTARAGLPAPIEVPFGDEAGRAPVGSTARRRAVRERQVDRVEHGQGSVGLGPVTGEGASTTSTQLLLPWVNAPMAAPVTWPKPRTTPS